MNRAQLPNIEPHEVNREWPTPTKAKLQGAVEYGDYLSRNNLVHTKQRAFDFYGIPTRSGQRIIAENGAEDSEQEAGESARRGTHNSKPEGRGAKLKIQPYHVKRMEDVINSGDINQRKLSWQELATKAGLVGENHVHFHTVRALMQDLEYHKCIACTKNWLSSHIRAERRTFARKYIHWKLREWKRVRWTDEIHFGFGPERKARIIRRPGERYCFDCIQERGEPIEKDRKRLHVWAMVGWNWKSKLHWYTTNNDNGKMSQQVYIDSVLNAIIKPLLDAGEKFIMQEDRDSGHGVAENNNKVRRYKKEIGLEYYFNPGKSPDLSVIENAFSPLKQKLANTGHWDEASLQKRAENIWDNEVSYDYINKQIESMEDRMHEILDNEGKMLGR